MGKKINGHEEGGGQYPKYQRMTRPIGERAVREQHAKDEYTGSYEDEIEQIFRDHVPDYSNASG
jgi:hypothetical protein